jgi:predicted N-acetyltransferase YhbS
VAIRSLQSDPDTVEEVLRLVCESFDLDIAAARPLFYEDPLFEHRHKWLLFDGDRAVCTATLSNSPMNMGGWVLPVAGIAGVATSPSLRGRGYATRLLTDILRALPSMGYAAAALVPSRPELYRKTGFAMAAERWTLTVSVAEAAGGPVASELTEETARPAIERIHSLHGAHRLGAVIRDPRRWRYFFWYKWRLVGAGEPPEQYMAGLATRDGIMVKELLPPGPAEEILSFLARWPEVTVSGWREDVEPWLRSDRIQPKAEPAREEFIMLRVVDVEAVMRSLAANRPHVSGCLAVEDDLIPENRGPWSFADGTVRRGGRVSRAIPIEQFSAALMKGWTHQGTAAGDLVRLIPHTRCFSLFPCDLF